jgi:hypothetical protein
LREFARGPVAKIVGAGGVLTTIIGLAKSDALWMWLFFGAGGLVVLTFWQFSRTLESETADAKRHLRKLARAADELAERLSILDIISPALSDPEFEGPIDGEPTTHPPEMQNYLFYFVKYLATFYVYRDHFPDDAPLYEEVKGWNRAVYRALWDPVESGDGEDRRIPSRELNTIAQAGTDEDKRQPLTRHEFEMRRGEFEPVLSPLKDLLMGATKGTKSRGRLERTQRAVEALREDLRDRGYGP